MPLIRLQTNENLSGEQKEELLSELSECVAEGIGKPVKSVMACVENSAVIMSNTPGPAAFVEVKSIGGLDRAVNGGIAAKVGDLLQAKLSIPPDRVYINFTDIAPTHWGWNGSTFG